jgi:hypothetical protein
MRFCMTVATIANGRVDAKPVLAQGDAALAALLATP